ncbi:MAG: hypothetical protein K9G58_10065 [Bacteroidales bacterium]|nr:hypothetical protein [Bacteroidales bacterium]MCF8387712.1 hypothetical protein [Bacteroidales bacterium]MCF8398504.1 hypothetical protein [Bacteroidales bacterium]
MKKIILLLIACYCIAIVSAQNFQSISVITEQNGSTRDVTDLSCPSNSNYSHLPDGSADLGTKDGIIPFDKIESTPFGPVASITFWMKEITVHDPLTVDIIFKHDAGGIPGTTFASFLSVPLSGTNTGESMSGFSVIEYHYVFPTTVSVTAGDWVGIADYPDDSFHHTWISSADGDNSCYMYGLGYTQDYDLAFCLGPAAEVPLSDWAIYSGIFMILVLIAFGFRKKPI